ncbi:SDR family NAD(P)-dependent oxidoreductase [Paenibacillus thalictri]|uniref:SDR family oxidoreductase n=1 Tax=Paenibacillus thalictri TaxID=2527873 RepID=A0A4Q9DRP4_9BACL|nr:SDR family NAD(P)-dependent oxidoreductase [Paenibacillus thalictri]TBL77827.1 SDR family oxidoreductase [Paenibacillus thalictri]
MRGLNGKIAVVAGGGRGIGKAIATALAGYGSTVVIGSRTESQHQAAAEQIRQLGGAAQGLTLDVQNEESVASFMAQVDELYGRIDVLVYCAGTNKRIPAESYTAEAWDEVMGINLKGAFLTCKEAGKRMIAQGGGSIITITSMLSHIATPNQSAYSASKGGLIQYSKVLAVEWGGYGVRVNCVSPGYIETDLNAANFKREAFRDAVLGKTPMGRFGETAEVAEAVCFLASPAASFISGAYIPVDGGFLAGHQNVVML